MQNPAPPVRLRQPVNIACHRRMPVRARYCPSRVTFVLRGWPLVLCCTVYGNVGADSLPPYGKRYSFELTDQLHPTRLAVTVMVPDAAASLSDCGAIRVNARIDCWI